MGNLQLNVQCWPSCVDESDFVYWIIFIYMSVNDWLFFVLLTGLRTTSKHRLRFLKNVTTKLKCESCWLFLFYRVYESESVYKWNGMSDDVWSSDHVNNRWKQKRSWLQNWLEDITNSIRVLLCVQVVLLILYILWFLCVWSNDVWSAMIKWTISENKLYDYKIDLRTTTICFVFALFLFIACTYVCVCQVTKLSAILSGGPGNANS